MTTIIQSIQTQNQLLPLSVHRFSVKQYHQMIGAGVFVGDEHCELLEGWIVDTYICSPPHATTITIARDLLLQQMPEGWRLRVRSSVTTSDSEPQPDLAVVRGHARRYVRAHPGPRDIALIVEVSDQIYFANKVFKRLVYARARIPIYWIINLTEAQVEVYSQPKAGKNPAYRQRQDYGPGDSVPLVIEGREIARIPVRDLLP